MQLSILSQTRGRSTSSTRRGLDVARRRLRLLRVQRALRSSTPSRSSASRSSRTPTTSISATTNAMIAYLLEVGGARIGPPPCASRRTQAVNTMRGDRPAGAGRTGRVRPVRSEAVARVGSDFNSLSGEIVAPTCTARSSRAPRATRPRARSRRSARSARRTTWHGEARRGPPPQACGDRDRARIGGCYVRPSLRCRHRPRRWLDNSSLHCARCSGPRPSPTRRAERGVRGADLDLVPGRRACSCHC